MTVGDPLSTDASELRAQAQVLDRSRTLLHDAAADLRAPSSDLSDSELDDMIEHAAQVLSGAADGIADSLCDLVGFVTSLADLVERDSA
ncbi:hypothetical protein [Yimella sp. cx-51]|uniref:hypothetical protein n=1 Tax=Yimella sp. cx-51 TaxID=2770551 RepID=UPI00165E2AA0|nr:hypothetical protein [Yimella sp. cx-51]MBC9958221.1 hypothetical protein [Yimella sp. cx-51]MBD2758921.1 hypothetical protein [Yimella sp. cx-573]QTH38746.1 hypothetical protein J5M86_03655 [Yimella sp. cx-51]